MPAPSAVDAIEIATDAYHYGYPLVTFDMALRQQTNAGGEARGGHSIRPWPWQEVAQAGAGG